MKRLICDHIRRIYADSIYRDRDVEYYFRAVKRFPHVDDPNAQCPWPKWTTMHYKGFISDRKNTPAWKALIEALRDENLIIIDKKKRVKRLFE